MTMPYDSMVLNTLARLVGGILTSLTLDANTITLTFHDGRSCAITDTAQSCCEERAITTTDLLTDYIGATLLGAALKTGPETDNPDPTARKPLQQCQFLELVTSKGCCTFNTYNVHNGYYDGFDLRATLTLPS